ncbi:MAG: FecR domain-containing protein, partial [Desulfomonile tiedjei]|nr:FecR domain-containing protein [Desulfomonile tiedjei]
MSIMFSRGSALWIIGFVAIALSSPSAWAQERIGSAQALEGNVYLRHANETEFRTLATGNPASLTDTYQTDKNSKLWLKFNDDSHNSMGQLSEIYYYDFEKSGPASFFGADMSGGTIRFIKKLPKTSPASAYILTTPTAIIQVEPTDRPADFVISVYNPKQTTVTVVWGRVRVKNVLEELKTERVLTSCQSVDIDEGKEPSRPIVVSSDTLKELIDQTTIPRTLPVDVPRCEESYVSQPPSLNLGAPPDVGVDIYYPPQIVPEPVRPCGPCEVWDGDDCVPCRWIGMDCIGGRCVRRDCPKCTVWDGSRCITCREIGRECAHGRCVPAGCRDCTIWDGRRCVPCREFGMACEGGRCVRKPCGNCQVLHKNRCVSCGELGLVCEGGRCVRKECTGCSIWNGHRCVPCEEFGKVCVGGRCVSRRDCDSCTFWDGKRCVSCAEMGMTCIGGRCAHRPCGPCQVKHGADCVSCEAAGMTCIDGR